MPGRRGTRAILQPRDTRLLDALSTFRIIDRDQAMQLAPFHSVPRANARLLQLVSAGILHRYFIASEHFGRKAIYHRAATRPVKESAVAHQLAINELHLLLARGALPAEVAFARWLSPHAPIAECLIPDGYFELERLGQREAYFVEVDLGTESLTIFRRKATAYLQFALSGQFERQMGLERFRVLVVAPSPRRTTGLRRAVAAVTSKLFYFSELSSIKREGLLAPVWLRPTGEQRSSLI